MISSTLPQDVGIEGIVLYEGENMFMMITTKNQVKRVPKRGHTFRVLGIKRSMFYWVVKYRIDYIVWRVSGYTFGIPARKTMDSFICFSKTHLQMFVILS